MEPPNLYPVKLYVYDLSKGLARRLSPIMLESKTKVPTVPTNRTSCSDGNVLDLHCPMANC